jgi:hypothetical protein
MGHLEGEVSTVKVNKKIFSSGFLSFLAARQRGENPLLCLSAFSLQMHSEP